MRINDFDDAYANMPYIEGAANFITRWQTDATEFRAQMQDEGRALLNQSYGKTKRQAYDLFLPKAKTPLGLFVFIHGGYWHKFSKDYWSHFSSGALAKGFAVAIPNYTLAPEARIADMAAEIAKAVTKASKQITGPIILCGHSAGGHLATRMICGSKLLDDPILARLKCVISISGVHDLRPLLRTKMNETLFLDAQEAAEQSPALLSPHIDVPLHCIVGADERPQFIHQNDLLAMTWHGLGIDVTNMHVAAKHHFNVIDDLKDEAGMVVTLLKGS